MKPLRIALAVFFSLLIIFIVTVAVLFLRTDPNRIFSYFSKQIADSVYIQLKAGDVKLDILKGIELSNVQVIDVQTARSNLLATFDSGRILYNPISLLWSSMDILNASVSGFRTTFDDLQRTVSNISAIALRSSNQSNPLGVVIRSITLENSEMIFNGVPFRIRGSILFAQLIDDSVIRAELDSDCGSVSVRGNLNRMSVTLKGLEIGKIAGLSDMIRLDSVKGNVAKEKDTLYRFGGDQGQLTYLNFTGSAVTSFSGTFDLQKNEIELGGFDLQSGKSRMHVNRFRTSTVKQDLSIDVSDVSAELSDLIPEFSGTFSGNLSLRLDSALSVSGDFSLSNADTGFIKRTGGWVKAVSNGIEAELEGRLAGGDFRASVSCSDLFGAPVDIRLAQDRFDAEQLLVPSDKKKSSGQTNAAVFPFTNTVNLTCSVGSILYKKLQTGKTDLRASVTGKNIRLEEAKSEFLKGSLTVHGLYADDAITGDAVLTDGKMKEFTALFLDSGKKLYGTVSGKTRFRLNLKDLYQSTGDISLAVRDGEIKNVFIQNRISAVLFDIPLDDIFFDSISLNGRMENGQLNVNALDFDSENIRMNALGQIRLQAGELSLRSEISFTKDYLSGLPNVAQIFTSGYEKEDRIAFGISVSGPLKNPAVKFEKTK